MTTRPVDDRTAPPSGLDRDDALRRLRGAGCRMTPARIVLLDDLMSRAGRVTADELIHDHPELDEATVYRTLAQFEEVGIVHHVHLGHGPATYQPGEPSTVPVVCVVCGRVVELPVAELEPVRRMVADRHEMELRLGHFALTARCAGCAGDVQSSPG